MTPAEKALYIAHRVEHLRQELGIPHDFSMFDLDRETFDQLPGEEDHGGSSYWKTPLKVTFFAKDPPLRDPAEELAELEQRRAADVPRIQELRQNLEEPS